jgi:hypothetical protein
VSPDGMPQRAQQQQHAQQPQQTGTRRGRWRRLRALPRKKTISGTNPNQMERRSLKWRQLMRESEMPSVICATPKTIEIFILNELKKDTAMYGARTTEY